MSLLLDALKKAALEKQRREQTGAHSSDSATTTPVPHSPEKPKKPDSDVGKTNRSESNPVKTIPVESISANINIATTKIDLGQLNAELEAVPIEQTDQTKYGNVEATLGNLDDGLVFDINDVDLTYLEPDARESEPNILPGTGIVEDFVRRANERDATGSLNTRADESISKLVIDEVADYTLAESVENKREQLNSASIALMLTAPMSTAPMSTPPDLEPIKLEAPEAVPVAPETVENNPLYTEDIKALFDGKPNPVEAFSASSGKEALIQLLARSKKAANAARRRMMLMYGFLSVTAILIVIFYYYLLHSEAPNVVALMPEIPANAAAVSPEATSETAPETLEDAAQETPQTNVENARILAASEADVTTGQLNAAPSEQNLNRASEQQVPAQPIVRSTPKARPDSATHYSLPPETIPKQAMIVERNAGVFAINEAIDRGYKAYQHGDISAASEAYQEALQQDPYQRDAMLGAAAVAVRQGRQQDALKIYQQRLARDPKDQYAQSGILALSENAAQNPELDSELSRLLLEYPEAAHLHFLKGSLFAARQEWAAAQVSFFEAWQRDNKNPDLAFNLAVALDHLAQPKEAARFYRQALTLADSRPASFSVNAIQRRLQDLEGASHEGTSYKGSAP